MNIKTAAAVIAATSALALGLTACGDDAESSSPAPADKPATSAAPAPAAAGGKSAAAVDGKALAASFETTCAKQGDVIALALTDNNNAAHGQLTVSASISGDTVQAVGIAGSKGGANGLPYAVGYGNGQPGGSAKLVKDGNTFKVTGEGVGTPDMTNPMAGAPAAKFDITFACSNIIG